MELEKYSFGMGDRFGHQGEAQLNAVLKAKALGVDITPIWNKSHREHGIIGTSPADVRTESDNATAALGWTGSYRVDADHINLSNVDLFVDHSDFFTIDVAEQIGKAASDSDIAAFVDKNSKYVGSLSIDGIDEAFEVTESSLRAVAETFLGAMQDAGRVYRHIESKKGSGNFITEVSVDECESAQTPLELFFILSMLAAEGVPAQTIAPKFTGRFNKGVDYVGDVERFSKEFNEDLAVIAFAIDEFNLPASLKLSVHSGSDKFSIYQPIHDAIKRFDAGLHVKTAGTTWLEELIGLAEAGGAGLEMAKEVYTEALAKCDALCAPYATVIDIDVNALPSAETVAGWDSARFVAALRHDPSSPDYNPSVRQLLHVGYKVAAQMGERYLEALTTFSESIARNVTGNLFDRHIRPIFVGQ